MNEEIKPCQGIHKVDGIVPTEFDARFADKVCDCGKVIFYKDQCGCPNTPNGWRIRSKENPNYTGIN